MDAVSQAGAQNVTTAAQIFALKKGLQAQGESALALIDGASQSAAQIQASNPAHLGQNIDVRA